MTEAQPCVDGQWSQWIERRIEEGTVFSTLYNESLTFLVRYVENFLRYTSSGRLYINLTEAIYARARDSEVLMAPQYQVGRRVFLVRASSPRQAFGAGLLLAHIQNFEVARSHGSFRFFCTLASNSLFFRPFDSPEIARLWPSSRKVAEVPLREENPEGNWPNIRGASRFMQYFDDRAVKHFCCNQIEGFFTTRENWALIASTVDEIVAIEKAFKSDKDRFPVEEVLPGTVVATQGDGMYLNICWNLWERKPWGGKADVTDLVFMARPRYPPNTFLLKWFDRDLDAPATHMLLDDRLLEQARALHSLIATSPTRDLVALRQIFDGARKACSARLEGADLLRAFLNGNTTDDIWIDLDREAVRQNFPVFDDRQLDAFIYYEELKPAQYDFQLKIRQGERVQAEVHWLEQNGHVITENKRDLVAYWYVKLDAALLARGAWLQLAVRGSSPAGSLDVSRAFGTIVLRLNGRYIGLSTDYRHEQGKDVFDFHYHPSAANLNGPLDEAYVGLPVINNVGAQYTFSLLQAKAPDDGA